jgi:hypothetical protein
MASDNPNLLFFIPLSLTAMQPQEHALMLLHAKLGTRTNPFHREVWRSVIVPANFSIFQLHFILAHVFKLPQDKSTVHISRPAKAIYPEHAVTRYQLVTPEQISGGQLEEIAHGVYIGMLAPNTKYIIAHYIV